jgi:hypothetical protein
MEYQRERERESAPINLLRAVQLSFMLLLLMRIKYLKPNNSIAYLIPSFWANTALFVSEHIASFT